MIVESWNVADPETNILKLPLAFLTIIHCLLMFVTVDKLKILQGVNLAEPYLPPV